MGLCCRVSSALRVEAISAAWSSLSARPSESSLASPRQPQRASPVAAYCGLLRRITAYCGLLRRWPALASLRKPRRASLAPLRPTGLLRLIAACCSLLRLIAAYCGLLWLIAACYGLLSLAQCRSDRHLPPRTARGRRSWSGGRKFRGDIFDGRDGAGQRPGASNGPWAGRGLPARASVALLTPTLLPKRRRLPVAASPSGSESDRAGSDSPP